MSIYIVDFKKDKFWRKQLQPWLRKFIKKSKCPVCKKKMYKGRNLLAYHSLPWVGGEWWCSWKCFNGGRR